MEDYTRAMKIVIDTNLFVAAYWNKNSASAKIIEAALADSLQPVCTEAIARELRLIIKTIHARPDYQAKVERFLRTAAYVDPVEVDETAEDLEDQKFLECAAAAHANFLVSNDEHLLKIGRVGDTKIVKPSEFWSLARL